MPRKILIVDDDPNALRLVSYALQAEGYDVATAANGSEALSRLPTERPDLVILDVMMPDMSGLEVCQRLRTDPTTARLPILMLSARGLVADRVSGLKSGADDYLPKPADTGELVARVEALLNRAAHRSMPSGQVLAFLGAKGGSGTTTVAVNVASLIAEQNKAVTVVELRPGPGTAAGLLGFQPAHDLSELLAMPAANLSQKDVLGRSILRSANGLRLLPAPRSGDTPCDISADFVEALVAQLLQEADYVVFDLAPCWSAANHAVTSHARFTAVVCEPDPLSVQCARATLATLQQWGIMGDLVGVILVNRGVSANALPLATLRATLQAGIAGTIPPAADLPLVAAKEGIPLATLRPEHMASAALKDLAGRLTQSRIKFLQV